MNWKIVLIIASLGTVLSGAKCSRDHVESVKAMNQCVELHRRKLFTKAVHECEKSVALDPENEKAYHTLAMVYFDSEDYDMAGRNFQKAIGLNDKIAMYHYQLGHVYELRGEFEQAVSSQKKAIELDPSLYKAHYRLGYAYDKLDDPQNAMQKYTDSLMQNPRFFESYRELGVVYLSFNFSAQGIQVLDEGIKALVGRNDNLAILHQLKGTALADQKNYEAAIKEFRQSLEYMPGMEEATFNLGWAYSYTNKDNAKIWLQKFIDSATQKTNPDYLSAASARMAEIQNGTPY